MGIQKHGFLGYLKLQCVPGGITGPILVLLVPLEFMSNLIVRPVTLALRLFANMFAGHILILLFALGGEYLLVHGATSWSSRSASWPGCCSSRSASSSCWSSSCRPTSSSC